MKNKLILMGILLSLSTATLWSCGGSGPGGPGSDGSGDTGINPLVLRVTRSSPVGDFGDDWQLDLIQDICPGGKAEAWGNEVAHVTIRGVPLNPNVSSNGPDNVLHVTNYRVTFFKENPSLPIVDQIESGSQTGLVIVPNQDRTLDFLIFDTGMKNKIVQDAFFSGLNNPPSLPFNYNMKLEIWGQDNFGNNFTLGPIIRLLVIEDYNNC